MFPLSSVLFPGAVLPLHVFEDRYRALMADCLGGGGVFGVVLIARGPEVGGGDQRLDVGTVARIEQAVELDDGRLLVVARGSHRFSVHRWLDDEPYPRAQVEALPAIDGDDPATTVSVAEGRVRRLRSLLSELGDVPALPHDLDLAGSAEQAGWQLCELAPLTPFDRQKLLCEPTLTTRMALLAELCGAMAADVEQMLAGGLGDP